MKPNKKGLLVFKSSAVIAAGLSWFSPVLGQVPGPSPAAGVLSGLSGLNDVQRPTAVAVETLCPFIGGTRAVAAPAGEVQLKASCDAIVGNAASSVIPAGLQAIAGEEVSAQGRTSIEAAGRNAIYGRLLALRSGGRNLTLAGSSLNLNGRVLSAAQLLPAGSSGGGAAADSGFGSKWGGFINANYNTGRRDGSGREDAFDFDDYGITGGVDYRFSDAFVAGVALSYSKTNTDFKNSLGNTDSKNSGISAYASYTMGDWYVDGHIGYARLDFDTTRRIVIPLPVGIDTTATGSTNGDQVTFNIGTGYDIRGNTVSFTPYARLDYLKLEVDGFRESEPVAGLGLDINSRDVKSLQTALGVRLWNPISTASGVFTPYLGLEWNHEFQNDSASVVAKYTNDPFNTFFTIPTDNPDRDFFTLSLGVSSVYQKGISAFVNFDTVLGLEKTRNYALTLGVRGEF